MVDTEAESGANQKEWYPKEGEQLLVLDRAVGGQFWENKAAEFREIQWLLLPPPQSPVSWTFSTWQRPSGQEKRLGGETERKPTEG